MKIPMHLIVMLALYGANAPATATPSQDTCKSHVTRGMDIGLIRDMSVDAAGLTVVISNAWNAMTYDQKLNLATIIECAFAGPGKGVRGIEFRDLYKNKVIATYRAGSLTIE